MIEQIKKNIVENQFVDLIRCEMTFNENEYAKLVYNLEQLSILLNNESVIDKDLALYLYTIPQMVRNTYLSFPKSNEIPEIASKLEDAWIDLDALVLNCLA